jgi:hypothetical protein
MELFSNSICAINDKRNINTNNLIKVKAENQTITGRDKTALPQGDYVRISIQDT